jgi:hypothetical protein
MRKSKPPNKPVRIVVGRIRVDEDVVWEGEGVLSDDVDGILRTPRT